MDVNTTLTQFTLSGLDDGEYTLTETVTPAHYNTISPITFTVTADHKIDWDSISTRDNVLTSLSGEKKVGEITFNVDKKAGTLTTDVVNNIGTTRPRRHRHHHLLCDRRRPDGCSSHPAHYQKAHGEPLTSPFPQHRAGLQSPLLWS